MFHKQENNWKIVHYIVPSICAMIVSFSYNVVDGMFVGLGVGANALAAVNLSVPFTEIMTALASMLTLGGATVTAIRKGRGDVRGANAAFAASALLVVGTGLVLTVIGAGFTHRLAAAFGATPALMRDTVDYMRWYSLFSIFFTFSILLSAFVRNDGSPGLAFWGMVAGAVANIFLDWLFIYPFGWGIKGAAIASGLGQILACVVLAIHFVKREGILRIKWIRPDASLLKKVATRGLPEFVIQISPPITIFCYNHVIISRLGEGGLAAFSACTYMLLLIFGVFLGVSMGLQPLIGNCYGDGEREDMQYFFRCGLWICSAVCAAVYIVYVLNGPLALSAFIKDAALMPAALAALKFYGLSMIPAAANVVYITYFLSTKKTGRAMLLACSRGVVLNTLFIFAVPVLFGTGMIWLPMIFAEVLTLVLAVAVKTRSDRCRDIEITSPRI